MNSLMFEYNIILRNYLLLLCFSDSSNSWFSIRNIPKIKGKFPQKYNSKMIEYKSFIILCFVEMP